MRSRIKRFSLLTLASIFLFVTITGNLAMVAPAHAQPTTIAADVPGTAWRIIDKIWAGLKSALLNAGVRAASYAIRKVAYDSAVWIASGGKGQQPLAFNKGFKGYISDVANEAGGAAIEEMGKAYGLNLCKVPDIKIDLALRVGLRTQFSAPTKPKCTFSEFQKNWEDGVSKYSRGGSVLNNFNLSLRGDPSSDFGIYTQATERIGNIVRYQQWSKTQDRQEGQGFKPANQLISDYITNPSQNVKKTAGGMTPDEVVKSNEAQLNAALASGDAKVFPSVLSIFLSTLTGSLINNFQTKGILPFGICVGGYGGKDCKSSGSTALIQQDDSVLTYEGGGMTTLGRAAVKSFFSYMTAVKVKETDKYDLLAQLNSCPEAPGIYNCRAGDDLIGTAQLSITIRQAIDSGALDGGKKLYPPTQQYLSQNNDINCYQSAYCYNNVRVLRQVRILPLGFELAVQNADPDDIPTLDKVVKDFDNPNSRYYHLIDPNWVIKAPLAKCAALVNGPTLLASDVPERLQDCVDLQTCVSYSSTGACNNYAYCTREKNTWKFAGDSCEEQYATCKTYDSSSGRTASYLERTLDKSYCNKDNVGCTGYSLSKNVSGWQNPAFPAGQLNNNGIYLNSNAEAGCSSNSVGCSMFNIAGSSEDPLYLKKAPDYLHCYDTNPGTVAIDWPRTPSDLSRLSTDPECSNYSKACIADEASCNWYAPLTGGGVRVPGRFIPATVSGNLVTWNDQCDQKCVGYNTYKEMPSNYSNGQDLAYIIPSSGRTCTAAEEGCASFTNLSTTTAGLETVEYYSYLRPCVTIQEGSSTVKTFITYEGSKESGFQLKTYRLVSTNDTVYNSPGISGAPKYFYKDLAELSQMNADCTEARYKAGVASLDCRQFSDDGGRTYYRYLSKTIPVTESCTPYRLNNPEFYVDIAAGSPAACANQRGYWDTSRSQCNMCIQNGEYRNGACIYEGIPSGVDNTAGISQTCSAAAESCRAYKGNAGNNIQTVLNENFESPSSTVGWSANTVWSPVSTHVGEHSIEYDPVGSFSKTLTLEPGRSYDLTFWAYGGVGGNLDVTLDSAGLPATSTMFGVVSVSSIWRQYHLGPFEFKGNTTTARLTFTHNVAGAVFIDNLRLVKVADYLYLVKNSLSIDPVCDSHLEDNLPGEALGCEAYKDPQNRIFYLTNFSYLCREDAIGCTALFDTFNSKNTYGVVHNVFFSGTPGATVNHFGVSCKVGDGTSGCYVDVPDYTPTQIRAVLGDGINNSTIYIPEDTTSTAPVYLVANRAASCTEADLGCTYAGKRIQTATGSYYATTTIKNVPDSYDSTLCEHQAEGCAAFSNGTSISYFKDPETDERMNCVYKTEVPYSTGSSTRRLTGWFWKDPAGTCANNHSRRCTTQTANQDCGVGIQCQNEPCYRNHTTYGLYSSNMALYDHYVGECPSDQNMCTEFVDRSGFDIFGNPMVYYLKNDEKLAQGDCNGSVSQKYGCALFDQTDNPAKYWMTAASYALSSAIDNNLVIPTSTNPSTTTLNDANIIIKVVQDRECGEWLECGSSYSVFDEVTGKYKNICNRIQRCNEGECGAAANFGTSTLNLESYRGRNVGWTGMDFSGYSLFGFYPIEEIVQMNFSTSTANPEWRLVKKVPCGSNCPINRMTAYSCGDTTNTTLYPGGRYVDGAACGTATVPGVCINHNCVQMPNGNVIDLMNVAPKQICRAYPESTSPFPSTPKIEKSSGFQSANLCNDVDDFGCECDYRKVSYGEGVNRYWKYNDIGSIDKKTEVADRDLRGICFGGVSPTSSYSYEGQECSNDFDCGGENGGGVCQLWKSSRRMLGWRGFCLENDSNRSINADPSQTPCLTWFPVESLEGTADINNQHVEAGTDWHLTNTGQYYCLGASGSTSTDDYYLELSPDGLYRQSNNWGSYAWADTGEARQILPDFGYGIPEWGQWRERRRKRNYNHPFSSFGRAHVDVVGVNAGKAGFPVNNERSIVTQAGLTNDHKNLVGFSTYHGIQAKGKAYSFGSLRYGDNTTLVQEGRFGFFLIPLAHWYRNERYANGGAMNTFDDYFNIAAYERSDWQDPRVFPVNKSINRLDIDRIEISPVRASNDINPNGDSGVFYIFPNAAPDGRSQSVYSFDDAVGTDPGKAITGFYQQDINQPMLFVANDQDEVTDQGVLQFQNYIAASQLRGSLFAAGGMQAQNQIWKPWVSGANTDLCIVEGDQWAKAVNHRWHAIKLNFDANGYFTGFDTAYCGWSGGWGGGTYYIPWVEYKIRFVYKKWCSNIVDGRVNLTDRNPWRTIPWTDRLWNLTESYAVPNLGYLYSTPNPSFASLDGFSNLNTQAVLERVVPTQWTGLSPTLCSGGRTCTLFDMTLLTAANGFGGGDYSPGNSNYTLKEGANLLGTLFVNARDFEYRGSGSGNGTYQPSDKFKNNTLRGDPYDPNIVPNPPQIHPLGSCAPDPNRNNSLFCEESPQAGFSVSVGSAFQSSGDVFAAAGAGGQQANRFSINFFMFADRNQMPLRRVIVDWGDGNAVPLEGFFRNQRGASSLSPVQLQCVNQISAPDYGHVVDMTCDNAYFTAANTYNCSNCMPKTCESATDTNCYAAPGSSFCPSQLQGTGCCIFVPRVQVKDNWGWCNGSCVQTLPAQQVCVRWQTYAFGFGRRCVQFQTIPARTVNGCYDYNNSSGSEQDQCVNLPQNRNGWTYLGGNQNNPGRIVLRPSILAGACNRPVILAPNGGACTANNLCSSGLCGADGFCKGANGAACVTDSGCVSGSCGFNNVCSAQVASGGACNSDGDCTTNACANGICKAPNGAGCTDDTACASGACVNNTCTAQRQPGETCNTNSDCVDNLCSAGVCKTPVNQACTDDVACITGACLGGACAELGAFSDVCDSNPDCQSNTCSGGRCLAAGGAACTSDAQCANGGCTQRDTLTPGLICLGARTGGSYCDSGPDCVSNSCNLATHTCLGSSANNEVCVGATAADQDAGCDSGACIQGVCAARSSNGNSCDTNADCYAGTCDINNGYCVGALGASCSRQMDWGCVTGSCSEPIYLSLNPPSCLNKKGDMGYCDSDPDCVSGACANSTSTPLPYYNCIQPATLGRYCNSDPDCLSGACDVGPDRCVNPVANGAVCDSDGDCLSGACFNSVCIAPRNVDEACDTDPDCVAATTSGCAILPPATTGTCQAIPPPE